MIDDLKAEWEVRKKFAEGMQDRIRREGIETIGLDERDWVILRLLFVLYKEGRNATTPEAQRVVNWFVKQHDGYGHEVMLAAFSKLAGELRTRNEKTFEPYWKKKGRWE